MRIVAGSAKGTRLARVPTGTRPMTDRAREGLFSSMGDRVRGARVLDVFAGTGALGIEALSRGAEHAVFVDSAPGAAAAIRDNLERAKLEQRGTVMRLDALRAVRAMRGPFELVLLDPPYRLPQRRLEEILREIAGRGVVSAGGTVVLSRPSRSHMPVIPVNWQLAKKLSYGDSVVLVFQVPRSEEGN